MGVDTIMTFRRLLDRDMDMQGMEPYAGRD